MTKKTLGTVVIVFGIIGGLLLFSAGGQMGKAGTVMLDIQSQSGNSIAEEYYQEMGAFTKGLGLAMRGLSLATIGVSLALGGNLVKSEE